MAKVSVECPGCFAKLNLPDRSKLGKKIKCPKCAEVFVAEAPDADDDNTEMLDDDDRPAKSSGRRTRGAAGGGKKPGKKSDGSGGGNSAVLIGGGLAALALLVVAGLFFGGVFGGGQQPLPAPPGANQAAAPNANPAAITPPGAHGAAPAGAHGAMPVAQAAATPATTNPAPAAATAITPAEKTLALRWMPADTELLIHLKVADLWQAPLLKTALETPQVAAGIAGFQRNTGLLPTEIESITFGIADLTGAMLRSKSADNPPPGLGPRGLPPNPLSAIRPEELRIIVVVRTKKPVDFDSIAKTAPNGQVKEKSGKKYVEVQNHQPPVTSAGWAPDSNTLIFGTLTDLLATIDRGETVTPRQEFAGVDHASHLVLASVMKETKPEDLPAGVEIPAALAMMQESLKQYGMQGASLGLSIKGGFDLNVAVLNGSPDGAAKLKTDLEAQLTELKNMFGPIKATAPPLLGDLGQLLLDNLKLEGQSQLVRVSTSIPDSEQQKLEQLPPVLMMMAMTGGLNPLAGGPAAGPGPGNFPPGAFGDMKKPGETEAVDAVKAEGLPDGITLSAKTSWSELPNFSADGKQSLPVQIMLDAKGDGLNTICAFGLVTTKTMTLDGGGILKLTKSEMSFGPDPVKALVPFDAEDGLSFEHPDGTMRVKFAVDPPAGTEAKITALEGTFKYLTAEAAEEFTIEDAPKKALRPLAEPELKAAGVKLLLAKGSQLGGETLTLSCGKGHFLGKVGATNPDDAQGVTMFFNAETDKGQTVYRQTAFDQSGKFPEKLIVKFTLYRNVKEHTASFRFENVPLPTPDSKPKGQNPTQLQPQQN